MRSRPHITLFFLFICCNHLFSLSMLKTENKKIVDPSGQEVILRGMGLGGWMLQEGYMLRVPGGGSQQIIKSRITDLIGEEACTLFYEKWLQNHVTKTDIDLLAAWGFNSVRLPMHFNLFTLPVDEEPVKGEHTWLNIGFELTDSLLSWCKSNQMYLILDLHAAPGGQGKDANISDYNPDKPSLWECEYNKEKTIALWRKIATYYADEPYIGGFDLLNEPNWTFEGKNKNGTQDLCNAPIWEIYQRITKAIREVNQHHIIFIEGNGWANNFNGFPGIWDDNLVLSFHKYWNPNNQESINAFIALRDKYNIPLWMGESGENSNKWFTDCIDLLESNNIGWAWWPLKKITSVVNPLTIIAPEGYEKILQYWRTGIEKPDPVFATEVVFNLAENLKAENCLYNKGIIDDMFRQKFETGTIPYEKNNVPGKIYAVNYDMGYLNQAYFDLDNEGIIIENNQRTSSNKGGLYRNDGVDIIPCDDHPEETNGYAVSYIEPGEWLKLTINAENEGVFKVLLRLKIKQDDFKLSILVNNHTVKKDIIIPASDEIKWMTYDIGDIKFKKDINTIQLLFNSFNTDINYIAIKNN